MLREGIAARYGILNGTGNFILTEIESHNAAFDDVLGEAQRLGYAEANPSADVDGFDARSILAALAFGERITPFDFQYAHKLGHTIRLVCAVRQTPDGLILSVRPALIPATTILAGVRGSYNAIWVRGHYGEDTFYHTAWVRQRQVGFVLESFTGVHHTVDQRLEPATLAGLRANVAALDNRAVFEIPAILERLL